MPENKNINNIIEDISERIAITSQNAGFLMMAAATSLGLVEFAHHDGNKHAVVSSQPIYATAAAHAEDPNAMRRERIEETHPHGSNSATNQRTPSRAGKA